jgi:precorrin-2 dehydrogenase/sirohydrochlorin ferrochelatase
MLQRRYQPGDLKDAFLAIAATDDPAVQKDVVQEASNQRLPLNVVDVPLFCSFIAPSVVRRGNITFAISTSGTSPALARWLREEVEQHFPPELAEMGEVVASVREEIRQRGVSAPAELWNLALKDPTFLALVRSSRRKDARAFLVNRLSAERR